MPHTIEAYFNIKTMILSGTQLAQRCNEKLASHINTLNDVPQLTAVLVGNNPASLRYIDQKRKACASVGINFTLRRVEQDISEWDLLNIIQELNADSYISWYIVQLPLPLHIDSQKIISAIHPLKDVDGFHPINQWKVLLWDTSGHIPCTPKWVLRILSDIDIELRWKKVVILWRSNIVWKPLAALCINAWATVTSCNSYTKDITQYTRHADIVISAVWKAYFLKAEQVSPQAILIDVGFTVIDWKIYGDIDYEACLAQWNTITPVPGWVGPLTVAMLLENTFNAHIQAWNTIET